MQDCIVDGSDNARDVFSYSIKHVSVGGIALLGSSRTWCCGNSDAWNVCLSDFLLWRIQVVHDFHKRGFPYIHSVLENKIHRSA